MDTVLRYRGQALTRADVGFIREFIGARPGASRRALSRELCAARGWVQPNGELRDAVCRGLLLALHRGGHIELPAPRWAGRGAVSRGGRSTPVALETTALRCTLGELGALEFQQVRRSDEEALVDGLLAAHHYLGCPRPVGEHLKYLVTGAGRALACFVWSSAARHLGPRDRYLGWSAEARRRNIRLLAYNTRFLVLPWVEVPHLASHLLGRMARGLSQDWVEHYGHPVVFLETFVDPQRFRGTCYRAANWRYLGRTTGVGKDARSRQPNRSIKEVLGYPLTPGFRERLASHDA